MKKSEMESLLLERYAELSGTDNSSLRGLHFQAKRLSGEDPDLLVNVVRSEDGWEGSLKSEEGHERMARGVLERYAITRAAVLNDFEEGARQEFLSMNVASRLMDSNPDSIIAAIEEGALHGGMMDGRYQTTLSAIADFMLTYGSYGARSLQLEATTDWI